MHTSKKYIQPSQTFIDSGGSQAESIPAAYALLWLTSQAMEVLYGRDWDPRGETAIFRQIQERPERGELPRELLVTIEWLHHQACGWWVWLDKESEGPAFVPTSQWLPYYYSQEGSRG